MTEQEIRSCVKGEPIKHKKSGNYYFVEKQVRLKINGSWGFGVTYVNQYGDMFCRVASDFSGFIQK